MRQLTLATAGLKARLDGAASGVPDRDRTSRAVPGTLRPDRSVLPQVVPYKHQSPQLSRAPQRSVDAALAHSIPTAARKTPAMAGGGGMGDMDF